MREGYTDPAAEAGARNSGSPRPVMIYRRHLTPLPPVLVKESGEGKRGVHVLAELVLPSGWRGRWPRSLSAHVVFGQPLGDVAADADNHRHGHSMISMAASAARPPSHSNR